jgi:hypothetical protein
MADCVLANVLHALLLQVFQQAGSMVAGASRLRCAKIEPSITSGFIP